MQIEKKTSSGISLIPMDTHLAEGRKLFVEGDITPDLACGFVRQMLYLNGESKERPIDLMINSPGGDINSGMLMYDMVQTSKAPVRMFCMGRAYSMGALLFASGRHGRYMLPHSELMLHEPLLGSRVSGNASSLKSISDSLLEARERMNELLARHTGRTPEEVAEATGYDHYFTAEESVSFGLCDGITDLADLMEG